MNVEPWIAGPPKPEHDGDYWLLMHDQGGHPFVEVAHVHMEFTRIDVRCGQCGLTSPALGAVPRTLEAMEEAMVPWVRIPGLRLDRPLASVWNVDGHLPATHPPDPRK